MLSTNIIKVSLTIVDEKIEVYPGHDYGSKPHSTIAHEKKNNAHMMEA